MLALAAGAAGAAAEKPNLAKRQASLSSEYSLAKDPNFYFVLDVSGRKLELRVRGMVLRSWPLEAMRFWGRPAFQGNVELVRKSALKSPQRIVKRSGTEGADAEAPEAQPEAAPSATGGPAEFDLEALELKDMPLRFGLDFDNGLHVRIISRSGGPGGPLSALGHAWNWYVGLPLRHLFGPDRAKRSGELVLIFDEDKDAQAIYWHFFEGIKGIIL